MKKLLFILLIFTLSCNTEKSDTNDNKTGYVRLFGKVTDFNNNPVDSVVIKVKDKNFNDLYQTLSDKNGNYSLNVKKGVYYSIYAIKESDYGITKLEYWAWNVPLFKDLEINPQYDRMEVYGIHAFEPKVNPYDTYRVYFRPMSLTKYQNVENAEKSDTIDIAPESLTEKDLTVKINNVKTKIVSIDKVTEFHTSGKYIFAYEIQVIKPKTGTLKKSEKIEGYDKITIEINSQETKEKGKGECFIKKS